MLLLIVICVVRRSWAPVEGRHSKIWWWWWWWWVTGWQVVLNRASIHSDAAVVSGAGLFDQTGCIDGRRTEGWELTSEHSGNLSFNWIVVSSLAVASWRRRLGGRMWLATTVVGLHAMFHKWCAWFREAGCQPGGNRRTELCHRIAEYQCRRSKCWCIGTPGRACQHAKNIVYECQLLLQSSLSDHERRRPKWS